MADSKPGVHVVQLRHVVVPPALVAGEKFIKWDEVRTCPIRPKHIMEEAHPILGMVLCRTRHWLQQSL